jgi:outer membrane protein OmpA-like peptidoglycan-associated protein
MMRRTVVAFALLIAACKGKSSSGSGSGSAEPAPPPPPPAGSAAPVAAIDASVPPPATAPTGEDLLSVASGAMVVNGATGQEGGSMAWFLFDEDPTTGWAAPRDVIAKDPLVLELPAKVRIDRLVLDSASMDLDSRLPEHVVVELSNESATAGFKKIGEVALSLPPADNVEIPMTAKLEGRWLRVIPTGKHGETDLSQLMELRAYGERLGAAPPVDFTGTYDSDEGWFRLTQKGSIVTGCWSRTPERTIMGGVEGRMLKTYLYGNSAADTGAAFLTFGLGGQLFGGYWGDSPVVEHETMHPIVGKRTSATVEPCPGDKKKDDPIATDLMRDGKVRLPGINFDTDSDVIRGESKPTLDRVVAILKENADLKVSVDGHTDSTSTPEHNQTLSEKRAASVVAYLTAGGIAADRLAPRGFGQTKPIAPNSSGAGRAQNRRVELTKR